MFAESREYPITSTTVVLAEIHSIRTGGQLCILSLGKTHLAIMVGDAAQHHNEVDFKFGPYIELLP